MSFQAGAAQPAAAGRTLVPSSLPFPLLGPEGRATRGEGEAQDSRVPVPGLGGFPAVCSVGGGGGEGRAHNEAMEPGG